jgi:hypothetical protein
MLAMRTMKTAVPSPRGNRWFHGAKVGGGSVFTAAGVLAGIGALADIGATKPHQTWLLASLGCFGFAVLLLIVGSIGEELTRSVTDSHAATLHSTALILIKSLELGNPANYPADGHRPKEAFHAHYPAVGRLLDRWDALLDASQVSRKAARDQVAQTLAALGVAADEYAVAPITSFLENLVEGRLRDGGAAQSVSISWSAFLSTASGNGFVTAWSETWITLPLGMPDETADAWTDRAKLAMARVDAALADVQNRPLDVAVADIQAVRAFKDEEMPALMDDLKRIVEMDRPPRKRACPTC